MTIAELERAIDSYTRVKKQEEKERASYDYILANVIARGVQAAIVGGEGIPSIGEIYGNLFTEDLKTKEEEKQAKKDELSALRFKLFANSYNKQLESKKVEVQKLDE